MNHNSGGCLYDYSSTSGCLFQRKGYNIKLFIMDLVKDMGYKRKI